MKKANPLQSPTFIRWLRSNLHDDVVTRMQAWVRAKEACARLGITDEKTRAFVFEHERKHAEMSEALHMQRLTK